jgi:hypothetical protein
MATLVPAMIFQLTVVTMSTPCTPTLAVDSGDVAGLDHLFPGGDLLGLQLLGGDGGELDSVDIVPNLGHSVSKLQLLVGDGGELDSVDIIPDLGHSVSRLNSNSFRRY